MSKEKLDNLFTPKQAAEKLQLSVRQMYRYIEQGKLRTIKLSHKVLRIAEKDLIDFIKKHRK